MSLEDFKATRKGAAVGAILARPDSLHRMEQLSRADRPAVEAVGADIAAAVGELDDGERKLVGLWVKELLTPRGLKPDRKGRVAKGNLFARGMIYRPKKDDEAGASAQDRLEAARRIVRSLPHPPITVDEFLAERRRAARRGE